MNDFYHSLKNVGTIFNRCVYLEFRFLASIGDGSFELAWNLSGICYIIIIIINCFFFSVGQRMNCRCWLLYSVTGLGIS